MNTISTNYQTTEELKNEKIVNYFRLFIVVVYILSALSIKSEIPQNSFNSIMNVSILLFSSSIFLILYFKYYGYNSWVKYIITTIDVVSLTYALYSFGEYRTFKTTAFLIYFMWIGLSVIRFNPKFSIYTGILSILSYSFVSFIIINSNVVELGTVTDAFTSSKVSLKNIKIQLFFLFIYSILIYAISKIFLNYLKKAVEHGNLVQHIQDSNKLIKKLKNENDELYVKANTDSLTGIFNRGFFEMMLEKEIDKFTRYKNDFSLVLIDIDDFKSINDTYGHDIGDKVILSIVYTISTTVRESDIVARWGGEEFIVLIPHTQKDNAKVLCQKLLDNIKNIQIQEVDKTITCSFGLSQIIPEDIASSLIKRADIALYEAKNSGKNRVVVG